MKSRTQNPSTVFSDNVIGYFHRPVTITEIIVVGQRSQKEAETEKIISESRFLLRKNQKVVQ